MPRMDSFGILHPTADDPITADGMLHIADDCGTCRAAFPEAANYVDAARASIEKADPT